MARGNLTSVEGCLDTIWEVVGRRFYNELGAFFQYAAPTLEEMGLEIPEPQIHFLRDEIGMDRGWEVWLWQRGLPVLGMRYKLEVFSRQLTYGLALTVTLPYVAPDRRYHEIFRSESFEYPCAEWEKWLSDQMVKMRFNYDSLLEQITLSIPGRIGPKTWTPKSGA